MEKQTIKDIVFEEIDKLTNNSFYLKGYVDSKKLKEKLSEVLINCMHCGNPIVGRTIDWIHLNTRQDRICRPEPYREEGDIII